MDMPLSMKGGDELQRYLNEAVDKLARGKSVQIGFMEDATYPAKKNTPALHVAQVAFWNEFGTVRQVPRPFFRRMIAAKSPQWGQDLAVLAKHFMDGARILKAMGERISDQLVTSINEFTTPPLRPSTIARKGFAKPLIDTAVMIRSVTFRVSR